MRTIKPTMLFLALALWSFQAKAHGQTDQAEKIGRSHNLSGFTFPGGGTEAELLKRLNRNKLLDLVKQDENFPKEFQEILKNNPRLLDEAMRRMDLGEGMPNRLDAEQQQKLREQIRDFQKAAQQPVEPDRERQFQPNDVNPPVRRESPERRERQENPKPQPQQFTNPESSPPQNGDNTVGKSVQSFAENLAKWDPSLKDSQALRQLVKAFNRPASSNDIKWGQLTEAGQRFQQQWGQWEKSFSLERLANKASSAWPSSWKTPSMPSVKMPSPSTRLPNAPSMPRFSGGTPSADGGGWILGVLVMLGLAALVLWKLWGGTLRSVIGRGRGRDWLGPWPVDPMQIRTRDDLVKAFEYLALKVFGFDARTWNHRTIEQGLRGLDVKQSYQPSLLEVQEAATQLANLYEQARYAPPRELLPEQDLEAARRQLRFLAGVSFA